MFLAIVNGKIAVVDRITPGNPQMLHRIENSDLGFKYLRHYFFLETDLKMLKNLPNFGTVPKIMTSDSEDD